MNHVKFWLQSEARRFELKETSPGGDKNVSYLSARFRKNSRDWETISLETSGNLPTVQWAPASSPL